MRSRLALHLPDADQLTGQEIGAVFELKPAALLCLVYAQWPADKGAAQQITDLVRSLGHDRLYVRFHADPHPPEYARTIGGAEAWGRLCAKRMGQYYGLLADAGVTLHAILANEVDADYEGGLNPSEASDFYRRALGAYASARPDDVLHVPAPTGAPETHRRYLERYKADGWVRPEHWIDGHGYGADFENVLNVLHEVMPGHEYVITETNDLDDFGWPIALLRQGQVRDVVYFTLNWAHGGEGRVRPPTADDAAKRMSLLRFPDRYAQFTATIEQEPAPMPSREELIAYARGAALTQGIDPDRFERQIQTESSFDPQAYNAGSGASGIAQIVERFHPGVDVWDPKASLDYATGLMRGHLNYWRGQGYAEPADYGLALSSYNAGRQATIDGLAGVKAGWPFAETVRYVSSILQISQDAARRILVGQATGGQMVKLSDVLSYGRSRIGDPYVWGGKAPGGFDCSGFTAWCYGGAIPAFTDAILDATARVESPAPGDLVLYEYNDPSQPGVRFPHVGLFLSDTRTLDARVGLGVGEHDQLPRSQARRYYRRASNVVVDTDGSQPPAPPPPPPPDELAALRAENERLRTVLGYATGDVAAAIAKEVETCRASLGALEAAVNTLKAQA